MSLQSVPAVILASVVIFIGTHNLNVFFRRPRYNEHLTFFFTCLAIGFYDICCALLYSAPSWVEGASWQRMQLVATSLLCAIMPWFLFDFYADLLPVSRTAKTVTAMFSGFFVVAAVAIIVNPGRVFWSGTVPLVKIVHLPIGATVVYNEAALGTLPDLMNLLAVGLVITLAFVIFRAFFRARRKGIASLAVVVILILLCLLSDTLVARGVLPFVYTSEYALMGLAVLISQSLSRKVVDAGRVEEALRESEARYRSIFEHSAVSLWAEDISELRSMLRKLDPEGVVDLEKYLADNPDFVRRAVHVIRVVDVNEATLKLYGAKDKEELLGPLDRTMDPEALPRFAASMLAIARGAGTYESESTARTLGGKLLNVMVSAYVPPGTEVDNRLLVSVTDITARKKAEESLRQAQKLEAIGTLAGGIAHDFNNLLTGILGHSSLLLEELPVSSPLVGDVEAIESSAQRASELAQQILTFSHQDPHIEMRAVDPNAVACEVTRLLQRTVDKSILIETRQSSVPLRIMANAGQIHQAILNICINAAEAMPRGGTLVVETGRENDSAVITVKDTGVGIGDDVRQRIFEPFFTTKEQGRGLGLPMVYGIVRGHGGDIVVQSQAARGTTFRIFLPLTDMQAPVAERSAEPPGGGRETVLVIDDELHVRRLLTRILERAGYTVLLAEDGARGLSIFEGSRGAIDLVVLDVSMPGMGGAEVHERLVALAPGVKVLLSSGYSDDERISAILSKGVRAFLRKPYKVASVLSAVREALDG